jgi:uncharacterized caspase-like protein
MTLAARKLLATLCYILLPVVAVGDSGGAIGAAAISQTGNPSDKQDSPSEVSVVPWRSERFGQYQALLIGIGGYRRLPPKDQLPTAINDAKAVAQLLLKKYGFNVKTISNATRATIFNELRRLREELTANDQLLLYYSGRCHMDENGKQGYWWASDANPADRASWIATAEISDQLKVMKAVHVLVVADSCYVGVTPYKGSTRKQGESRDNWLRRLSRTRSRTVLSSGTSQPVPDPVGADHSLFATAFLKALRENDAVIDAATLFLTLKTAAPAGAPVYSAIDSRNDNDGDFVFVPRIH